MSFYSPGVGWLPPGLGPGRTREEGLGRRDDDANITGPIGDLGPGSAEPRSAFIVRRRPNHASSHASSMRPSGVILAIGCTYRHHSFVTLDPRPGSRDHSGGPHSLVTSIKRQFDAIPPDAARHPTRYIGVRSSGWRGRVNAVVCRMCHSGRRERLCHRFPTISAFFSPALSRLRYS